MRLLVLAAFTAAPLGAVEIRVGSSDITAAEQSANRRRTELLQRIAAVERSNKQKAEKRAPANLRGSTTTAVAKKAALLSTKSKLSTTATATERADLAFVKEFTARAAALSAETDDFLLNLDNDGAEVSADNKEGGKQKHAEGEDVSGPRTSFGPNGCLATYKKGNSCWLEGRSCASAEMRDTNLGFTCVHEDGSAKRHFFGENAYQSLVGSKQTFSLNTLVTNCSLCLGLDDDKRNPEFRVSERATINSFHTLESVVEKLSKKIDTVLAPAAAKADAKRDADKKALWGADYSKAATNVASEATAYVMID